MGNGSENNVKLRVSGLAKRYIDPPVQALKDVEFEVHDGDFFCIIGPSGCGKSTTLRLIAGFEKPTDGQVLLDGNEVQEPGPDRAMVFQDLNQLFPWKTTLKNVVYPLKVNKLYDSNENRMGEAKKHLRMVGLDEKFDSAFPHQLSGGMKQRVAIARALALDPKVLLRADSHFYFAFFKVNLKPAEIQGEACSLEMGKTIFSNEHSPVQIYLWRSDEGGHKCV